MDELEERTASQAGVWRRLLNKAGLDQPVAYALLTRAWQSLAGAVTLFLIGKLFAPETQGFYYTFSSLLALQSFVELGLSIVIVNLASREWSRLTLGESGAVSGEPAALSRLASLARFTLKWYAGAGLLFVLGVGIAGEVFFSGPQAAGVSWQAPWRAAVALAGVQLCLLPLLSLLEGCNQVASLNRFRLLQSVAESAAAWTLFATGAGLWVVAGSLAARVATTVFFLSGSYRKYFRSLFSDETRENIGWREEMWPMQWRIGLQGMMSFLMFSLFNPVMFRYHGAGMAGRMGMTLQLVSVIQVMSIAWVQTKVPLMGMLAAKREFPELDKIWLGAAKRSFGFSVVASLGVMAGVLALGRWEPGFSSRLLDPLPTGLFLIASGLMQISSYQSYYLRAHGREPFLLVGVLGGLIAGLAVFLLGSRQGPIGAAAGYLAVVALLVIPMGTVIWSRRRREWQK